jgi:glutaredoxin
MYQLIKVVYDDHCKFILDIIDKYNIGKETYSLDHYKERKKGIPILSRNGTRNVPLVVLIGDDSEKVIWSENNPDWEKELDLLLKDNK